MKERPQDRVLDWIRSYVADHPYPPTTREITAGCGLSSTRAAHEILVSLRAEGKLEWDEGRARTLRVITDGSIDSDRAE